MVGVHSVIFNEDDNPMVFVRRDNRKAPVSDVVFMIIEKPINATKVRASVYCEVADAIAVKVSDSLPQVPIANLAICMVQKRSDEG